MLSSPLRAPKGAGSFWQRALWHFQLVPTGNSCWHDKQCSTAGQAHTCVLAAPGGGHSSGSTSPSKLTVGSSAAGSCRQAGPQPQLQRKHSREQVQPC